MHKAVCLHVKVRDGCQVPSSISFHSSLLGGSLSCFNIPANWAASFWDLPVSSTQHWIYGYISSHFDCMLVLGIHTQFFLYRKQYTQWIHIPFFIRPNQTKQTTKTGYVKQESKSQSWKFKLSYFSMKSCKMLKSLFGRRKDTCSKGMVKS